MRSQSLPLPLIESPDSIDLDPINHENLAVYGYLLLISTWMLFIISINSIFEIWRFIIQPLQSSPTSLLLYDKLTISFETIDSYIIKVMVYLCSMLVVGHCIMEWVKIIPSF